MLSPAYGCLSHYNTPDRFTATIFSPTESSMLPHYRYIMTTFSKKSLRQKGHSRPVLPMPRYGPARRVHRHRNCRRNSKLLDSLHRRLEAIERNLKEVSLTIDKWRESREQWPCCYQGSKARLRPLDTIMPTRYQVPVSYLYSRRTFLC